MRIALVMDALGGGGAERQCVLAANQMALLGHHVAVISYGDLDYCVRYIDRARVEFVQISARGLLRLARLRALTRTLRQGRFDVAHAFHMPPGIFAAPAAALAGVPRFFMGFRGQHGLTWSNRVALRLLAGARDGWIVNSTAVRDHLVRLLHVNPELIHVVRNGFPPLDRSTLRPGQAVRAELGLDETAPLVTLVGNLRLVKNIDMFLRVADRLRRAGTDAQFVIAGEGKEEQRLKDACRTMGLDGPVKFVGFCRDVPSLLAASRLAILTSASEGLPNVLIEAALAGVPSVSTDNGGASDAVLDGQTGFIVPLDDDEAMACRVQHLLADAGAREAMGQAAMAHATKTFSLDRMARDLLRVYDGARGRSHARDDEAGGTT